MTAKDFVGTWRLVAMEYRSESDEASYPAGRDPVGYLLYTKDGYMSVAFMIANRRLFASEDVGQGTDEEKAQAFETYFSYSGRYSVVEDRVIHHIEVSLFPNWTGTEKERFFEFRGNRLTLRTAPYQVEGRLQTAHLVWERASI